MCTYVLALHAVRDSSLVNIHLQLNQKGREREALVIKLTSVLVRVLYITLFTTPLHLMVYSLISYMCYFKITCKSGSHCLMSIRSFLFVVFLSL